MKISETTQYEIERQKPMPSKLHAAIQSNLILEFGLHYRDQFRLFSELSLSLQDWESVPDIAIYPQGSLDFDTDEIKVTEIPLAVIEILSPTQSLYDLTDKIQKYFEFKVSSCWIVIPNLKNIHVFEDWGSYQVFQVKERLVDSKLNVKIDLDRVFV